MTTEFIVLFALKVELALSGAIALILVLRRPARRLIGPELAYGLWALAPAAALATLFPSLPDFIEPFTARGLDLLRPGLFFSWTAVAAHARLIGGVWLAGTVAMALLFALAEWRFQRKVRARRAGPAVTGAWFRMVVPLDYAERFSLAERQLIREHERGHMQRRDPRAALLIAVGLAFSWFNPLAHIAAACMRLDQELACDARVMARHPGRRRQYAETLLKAHLKGAGSPLACALSVGRRHPLEIRMAMLAQPRISLRRDRIGVIALAMLAAGVALLLWALAPI
jgi:beta-lactamase regulating signal transducer with metallopeptidase domain